jgi:hypothetical protein
MILSSTRPANHHRVKPAGDSAGQPLNRVFERYRTERYELAATIVNALAHHQSAVDPDVAMRHVTAIVANGSGDTSQSEAWLRGHIDRITTELNPT